jgi:cytochrome c553
MKTTLVLIAFASITSSVVATEVVGDAKAAANKVSMCIGCHAIAGYRTTYPETYKVPMLGGQSGPYLESALKAYRRGERTHPTMHGVAASLSDQDIADLAAYYAQQK